MSEQIDTYDASALALLAAARNARDVAISARAETLAFDESLESLLAKEANYLADGMERLHKRRWLGVLANGKRSVPSRIGQGATFLSGPLLKTQAEFIDDPEDGLYSEVTDFYIFKSSTIATKATRDTKTEVKQVIKDENTMSGESRVHKIWSIQSVIKNDSGAIMYFNADSTDRYNYRRDQGERIYSEFTEQFPWLSRCVIDVKSAKGTSKVSRLNGLNMFDPNVIASVHALEDQLQRGTGWDYPEDDLLFPLGLVLKAQDELKV